MPAVVARVLVLNRGQPAAPPAVAPVNPKDKFNVDVEFELRVEGLELLIARRQEGVGNRPGQKTSEVERSDV